MCDNKSTLFKPVSVAVSIVVDLLLEVSCYWGGGGV